MNGLTSQQIPSLTLEVTPCQMVEDTSAGLTYHTTMELLSLGVGYLIQIRMETF